MKKLLFLIIAIICLHSIFGQKKEVAVLQPRVIGGGTVSANDQLIISSSMKKAFTQIDGYGVFTRTDQSLIAAEQAFQRSGNVDDKSIKEVGKQTGVAYLCVFTLAKEKNELVVNSDIINVVTGEVNNSDYVIIKDVSDRDNVATKCQDLAYSLLGVSSAGKTTKPISSNSSSTNKEGVTINGITWAKKNVGAVDAEDYGNYYTWEQATTACPKGWRLPTKEEFETLIKAGSVWTTQNGKTGRKFGDSNNFIFLPAAGCRHYSDGALYNVGNKGHYWSSTPGSTTSAYYLVFGSENASTYENLYRTNSQSVRCVLE